MWRDCSVDAEGTERLPFGCDFQNTFVNALYNSYLYVPIESPDAIKPLQTTEQLDKKEEVDNVLLEHRLALEFHARGKLRIFPVFRNKGDTAFNQPFNELPQKPHRATEKAVKDHLLRLNLGQPKYKDLSVRETWATILRIQGKVKPESASLAAEAVRKSYVHFKNEGRHVIDEKAVQSFNIAIVGSAGLGKTTLQRWMFKDEDKLWETPYITEISQLKRDERRAQIEVKELERALSTMIHSRSTKELQDKKSRKSEIESRLKILEAQLDHAKRTFDQHKDDRDKQLKEIQRLHDQRKEKRAKQLFDEDDDKNINEAEVKLAELNNSFPGDNTTPTVVIDRKKIGIITAKDKNGNDAKLDVTLIDTPGTGSINISTEESVKYVMDEIKGRLDKHSKQATIDSANIMERNDLVHLCLYMLPPNNRLRSEDVEMLQRLHSRVPVLILLAKSDTLNKKERDDFGRLVNEHLQHSKINVFHFSPVSLAAYANHVGADDTWAVFSSKSATRKYPWGDAVVDDVQHNDLPALKQLLLNEGGWHDAKKHAMRLADEHRHNKHWLKTMIPLKK